MKLTVKVGADIRDCHLIAGTARYRCAIGAGGYRQDKREGDGATPLGVWPMRRVFYRPDRGASPTTGLPVRPISANDGWSDDAGDPKHYNRLVTLPYESSHEVLWREDSLYDLVIELGFNDDPPIPGLGSAIFMHIARPGYLPTEGCVALKREDLLAVLEICRPDTVLSIEETAP
jgi:L,D-peptidoglycan transpeptidase YkuD (ErfK/YbiS/YcfS/YnhG family)